VFVPRFWWREDTTTALHDWARAHLGEFSRVAPTWDTLLVWLTRCESELTVVPEATLNGWWLERQLTAAGYQALVVDAYQLKPVWQTRTKADAISRCSGHP
jgi:transposase